MATSEVAELRKQLESLQRSHETLLKTLSAPNVPFIPAGSPDLRRSAAQDDRPVFADSSTLSSDESDGEDESHYVQAELPSQSFDHAHLRDHLKQYEWKEHGREILSAVITNRSNLSKEEHLFSTGTAADRAHYSHFQVYDVGLDGVAKSVESSGIQNGMSKATEIWHSIRNIGGQHPEKKIVGRITVAREPAPILFGALHLTMHEAFDVDELFRHLVETKASSAHMHRAFNEDQRHQKTFFFNFEYYTIIGEDCNPMDWQRADKGKNEDGSHVPLSRCSAVVALALFDEKPRRIRNRGRRARTKYGWVQDIWSSWQVLQIECFPDWKHSTEVFEMGHRYLNGPEAFLHALLAEYRDARKRYDEIYNRITALITPPLGFIFDSSLRDERLFEDKAFTWTRRYFYAHQTLGNVNDSIKSMIDAFEDTFIDEVWEGNSKTLWPLMEESPRNDHWKRRLRLLRFQFENEMKQLQKMIDENNGRRKEIESLQAHLFSGTSIQESRKSVELSDTTVQQGRNIKLLTIVNLFFMPMTFVTSVFGMSNMSGEEATLWKFGITTVAICVPFFSLIGFLSTQFGYGIWVAKTKQMYRWMRPNKKQKPTEQVEGDANKPAVERTLSTEAGMRQRMGSQLLEADTSQPRRDRREMQRDAHRGESFSHPHIKRMVEAMGEGRQSGLTKLGTVLSNEGDAPEDNNGKTRKDTIIQFKE